MDKTHSWTLNRAFSTQKSGARAVGTSSNDLHLEGSPEMPDLLPSRSPRLTQERIGLLPSKYLTETTITPGIEDRQALPALPPMLQKEAMEENAVVYSEQLISSTKHEVEHSRARDKLNFGVAGGDNPSNNFPHSKKHKVLATKVIEPPTSWNEVSLPGLDGILNRCALSFVGRTRESALQPEKNQENLEENVYASTTGTARRITQ